MRRDSRFRKGIPSILLLFLVSVSVLTPLGGFVRPAAATSSTTMQEYTFQTPGSFFNGQPGPNITVTYRFYPSGTVNWFNSQGGNVSIVIPSLASQTVQFNSTAFWYSISRTIFGNTISATVYFFKLTTHSYPSPNMKIKVDGTSTLAATLSFSLQNVNNAQLIQDPSDPCTISYGGFAGFSWCDAPGIISFNQATSLVTVSLPAGQFSIDPTTIGTSNTISATQYNFQRKVFFCQTRYWAFYSDGSNIVWRTSTDGSSWSGTTSVTAGGSGERFSTWNDCANSKVYYAIAASTTTFQHRAGTLNSDGTISWDYAEVSVTGSFGTEREPTIAKDTSGILWIAFVSYKSGGGKGDYLEVWKCTISGTNCGTGSNWATMAPFPAALNSAGAATAKGPRIQPLTSGKLSLVSSFSGTSGSMVTRTYSGSAWNAATSTSTEAFIPLETAALAISDTTYFVGVCTGFGSCTATGNIVFWSCAYPCSTTPTATQLNAAGTNDNAVISSDDSQQLVVAYGASGLSTSIFYRISTDGGSSWQTEQPLASSESIRLDTLTASYTKGNSLYEFLWKDNAVSSPFNIRFATLSVGSAYSVSPSDDISPALADSIDKGAGKFLTETPPLSDSSTKFFQGFRSLAELISSELVDSISKAAGKFVSETPPISDSASRFFQGVRSLGETPPISDASTRFFQGFRSLPDSIGTLMDSISKSAGKFASEAPTLSDAVSGLFTGFRSIPENLGSSLSDSISKMAGKFPSETPSFSDAVARLFTGFRGLSETPTLADVVTRVFTGFRGLSESPTISDAVSRLFTGFRGMTETPTISDALSKVFTGFRALAESPAISDALDRVFTGFRALSETPTVSDAVARVFTGFRSMSESLAGMTDSISKSAGKFLSDAPPLSDVADRLLTGFRALTETLSVSDALSRVFTGFRALAESPAISDALDRVFTGFRALSETPTVSDTVARVYNGARTLAVSLTLSDVVSKGTTTLIGLTEDMTSTLSDSASGLFTGFRGASENLASSITDSILKVAGRFASISENPAASISGAVTRLAVLARVSPADLSSISDSKSRVFTGSRGISQSLASVMASVMADPVKKTGTARFLSLTENISATLSAAVSRARTITLRFADTSPFSESNSASSLVRSIRDVLDDFYYNTVMPTFASLAREQTRSGGSNSPLSFFTDPTVVASGMIAALAVVAVALFFRRRRSG